MKKSLIVLIMCLATLGLAMRGTRDDPDSRHFEMGRSYRFVRTAQSEIETAEFTRYEDGSAGVKINGGERLEGFELDDQAWRRALNSLRARGFVEESKATGRIRPD